MTTIAFYQALSNLFYAAAFSDKNFAKEEKKCINNLVIKEWNYEVGKLDSKELVYQTLRELLEENIDSDDAYAHFENYFLTHRAIFSKDLKMQIMKDAEAITAAYSSRNKSELIFLTHLHRLFWKE